MAVAGIGIDICEVARMKSALEAPTGARFRDRVFTDAEQAYCEQRKRGRFESYAARFAAKEAAMKVLGSGWGQGVGWRDIEVVREETGPPVLRLHGEAAALARKLKMGRWLVTLSHSGASAIAWVLAEHGEPVSAASGPSAARARRGAGAGSAPPRPRSRR
jgi:holo-[acyl-carrier protein] synthase